MKKILWILSLVIVTNLLFSQSIADFEKVSIKAYSFIIENKTDSLYELFDDGIKEKVGINDFKGLFTQLESQAGNFKNIGDIYYEKVGEYTVFYIPMFLKNQL